VRREDLLVGLCGMLGFDARVAGPVPAARGNAKLRLRGTVLVVEDNLINQKVTTAMLEALGLDWVLAGNGQVAVEKVRGKSFDLVLMDCQMPIMDGYAATAAIRALPGEAARVPILALTANALQGDEAKCLEAGMDGFLPKPLTFAMLGSTLSRWLPAGIAGTAEPAPVAAHVASTGSTLNMRQIATLQAIGKQAGTDLVGEMLRTFLSDANEQLQRLEAAIAAQDAQQLTRCAHGLKSSTANMGAEELSALYRRLEQMGRNNHIAEAGSLLLELHAAHERVVQRANQLLQEAA
jgi:CheY-like chemotaxis protein